ncbi:hypothetical protein [Gimibacter soli]|uniref:Uncharacterized protein n=1 Tax=Gimibacter soli TaxID=3024400 RepID=A0AAE9XTI1_9PROT|nr:hypothetical protein [Gimibacter soli]WCL54895.1 hypothetical protein PH603_03870 [Gimibacter soli]
MPDPTQTGLLMSLSSTDANTCSSALHRAATISDPEALTTLLREFHVVESDDVGARVTVGPPYPNWSARYQGEENVGEIARQLVARFCTPEAPLEVVVCAVGVAIRLYEADWSAPLIARLRILHTSKLDLQLQYELAWQLRVMRLWRPLEQTACRMLASPDRQLLLPHQVSTVADFALLARYRRLLPYITGHGRPSRPALRRRARESLATLQAWIQGRIQRIATNTTIPLHRAIAAQSAGDLIAAEAAFADAASSQGCCIGIFQPHRMLVAPTTLAAAALPDDLWLACETPPVRAIPEQDAVLVSTDEKYFRRYGETFLASAERVLGRTCLHLHCVGFRPDEKLLAQHAGMEIRITVDPVDMSGWQRDARTGYFAGARYLFLHRYLDHYARIAVADIDGQLMQAPCFSAPEEADVQLVAGVLGKARRPMRLPWEAISAGNFSVNATAAGRDFARFTAQALYFHMRRSLADPERFCFFFADQVALWQAWRSASPDTRFAPVVPFFTQQKDWAWGKNKH